MGIWLEIGAQQRANGQLRSQDCVSPAELGGDALCRSLASMKDQSRPGSWLGSWVRDVMPSFLKTLARWYSTVPGLMNSWAAISLFVAPSAASVATRASCGVRSSSARG